MCRVTGSLGPDKNVGCPGRTGQTLPVKASAFRGNRKLSSSSGERTLRLRNCGYEKRACEWGLVINFKELVWLHRRRTSLLFVLFELNNIIIICETQSDRTVQLTRSSMRPKSPRHPPLARPAAHGESCLVTVSSKHSSLGRRVGMRLARQ
ncbi:hypothetical protein RRG08_040593 [Elysia crispata]|uniref:Uncharacterized protein n=1 Tax=Elysia crispata TaxID=231223 RepID=A0AAE0YJT0_9GAST|nr:hypothetical protein RRG08_040593 [Elysia crispata]